MPNTLTWYKTSWKGSRSEATPFGGVSSSTKAVSFYRYIYGKDWRQISTLKVDDIGGGYPKNWRGQLAGKE